MKKLFLVAISLVLSYTTGLAQKIDGMWATVIAIDGHKYSLDITVRDDIVQRVSISHADDTLFCGVSLPSSVAKIKGRKIEIVLKQFDAVFSGKFTNKGGLAGIIKHKGPNIAVRWYQIYMAAPPPSPSAAP